MKDKKVKYYYNPFPYIKSIIPRTKTLFFIFLILMLVCSVTGSGFFWSARSTRINPLNSAFAQFDNNSIINNGETGQANTPQQQSSKGVSINGFTTYESHNLGFNIQYPSGWNIEENPDPLNFVTINPPNTEKFFKVSVVDLGNGVDTIDEFVTYVGSSAFNLIESDTNASFGTHKAFLAQYKEKGSSGDLREILQKGIILNTTKGYLLEYTRPSISDFEKYLPIAQKMFDSFRLSSEPESAQTFAVSNNEQQKTATENNLSSKEPNIQQASVTNESESSTENTVPVNSITAGNNGSLNPLAVVMGENSSGQINNTTNGNPVPVGTSETPPTESQSSLGESTTMSGTTNGNLQANNKAQTPNTSEQTGNNGSQVSNSSTQTGQPANTEQPSTNQPSSMVTSVPSSAGTNSAPELTSSSSTDTGFEGTIKLPTQPPISIHLSMKFTPYTRYSLTQADLNLLHATGIPVFNFQVNRQFIGNQFTSQMKFFIPYDSLPLDVVAKLRSLSPQPSSTGLPYQNLKLISSNPSIITAQNNGMFTNIAEEAPAGGGESSGGESTPIKLFNYYNDRVRESFEGVAGVIVQNSEDPELGLQQYFGLKVPEGGVNLNDYLQKLGDVLDALGLVKEAFEIHEAANDIKDCLENPAVFNNNFVNQKMEEKTYNDAVSDAFWTLGTKGWTVLVSKMNVGLEKVGEMILLPVSKLGEKVFGDAVKQDIGFAKKLVGGTGKCNVQKWHGVIYSDYYMDINQPGGECMERFEPLVILRHCNNLAQFTFTFAPHVFTTKVGGTAFTASIKGKGENYLMKAPELKNWVCLQ